KGIELLHHLRAKAAEIYVIDTSKSLGSVDAGITHEQALIVLKKEAEQTLHQLAEMYHGNELMKFMPEGNPDDDILKTAKNWNADLLVLGTHGRTGLKHLLMGSVAERVLRHSDIPVMVVR